MHSLSNEEIAFILDDIKARGIDFEDLQENLLDHICCVVENELKKGEDFYQFYETVLPRFFENELQEIQIETNNLLRFKNFYSMKKTLKISGILTVFFIFMGILFKTFHWPGAGLAMIIGGFVFSFLFLPLLIIIKFKDDDSTTDKVIFGFGFVLAIAMSVGLLFKLMWWPGANNLLFYSTSIFTFVYVPVYFVSRIKRAELRFNTIVNSVLMMACGGIFYALFDLSYSHKFANQMEEDHIYLHENAIQLFASNDRIFSSNSFGKEMNHLHDLSESVNVQIEEIASHITENNSTQGLNGLLENFAVNVNEYNEMLLSFKQLEMKPIEEKSFVDIYRLRPKLAMKLLARLQQHLAVNESIYLSNAISKTSAI